MAKKTEKGTKWTEKVSEKGPFRDRKDRKSQKGAGLIQKVIKKTRQRKGQKMKKKLSKVDHLGTKSGKKLTDKGPKKQY